MNTAIGRMGGEILSRRLVKTERLNSRKRSNNELKGKLAPLTHTVKKG